MDHINYFQALEPLNIGTKFPYSNTFLPVHVCFEIDFLLSSKAQLVAGLICKYPGLFWGDKY